MYYLEDFLNARCCSKLFFPVLASCLNSSLLNGLPLWLSGKESICNSGDAGRLGFDPWVGNIPWRRKWQPTPVFLPGKYHGQRSLAGYSPWGVTKTQTWQKWLNTLLNGKLLEGKWFHFLIFIQVIVADRVFLMW